MQWLYSAFLISLFAIILGTLTQKRKTVYDKTEMHFKNTYSRFAIFLYSFPLIFVSAFREGFIDTYDYRHMYEAIGTNLQNVFSNIVPDVEKGYLFFTYLLNLISKDSQILLIVTSIVITVCFVKFMRMEAYDVSFSLLIYLCQFWMSTMNGIRQILVAGLTCLLWGKWSSEPYSREKNISFIILLLVLSTFHKSILICIPVFMLARGNLFNKGILVCVLGALTMLVVPSVYNFVFGVLLGTTEYSDYIAESASMGGMRFIISCVPFLLICIYYWKIYNKGETKNHRFIWMMNISIFNFCCSMLALKMVYFARIGLYLDVFNFILIPYLIEQCFNKRSASFIKLFAIITYIMYFYFQMQAYGGYVYGFKLVL